MEIVAGERMTEYYNMDNNDGNNDGNEEGNNDNGGNNGNRGFGIFPNVQNPTYDMEKLERLMTHEMRGRMTDAAGENLKEKLGALTLTMLKDLGELVGNTAVRPRPSSGVKSLWITHILLALRT